VDSSAPLSGLTLRYPFWVEGRPRTEGNADDAVFNSVSPDFFRTLRLPLREGRLPDARDDERGRLVCVINETLARRLFPGESAVGKRIQTLPWLARGYREVVGVVGDVRQENLSDPPPPQIYVPLRQSPWFFATMVIRTDGPAVSAASIQAALRRADPTASMSIVPLEESIARTAAVPRLRTALFGLFGLVALALSAVGIHASMAFTVNQRVREFGVRLALGATPARVLGEVLARAGRIALVGVAAGTVGAVALGRLLQGLLHGVEATDPLVLGGLALFLPAVALLAAALPAARAARLDPVRALQAD
jgi:putative ABC transport system permease protein